MTPLERAWEHYGGTLLGTRGRVKARCCLHEDKNASASVDLESQRWSCFAGCGYGDIYELVKLAEGIDPFPERKAFADERFGVASLGSKPTTRNSKRKARRKTWT